MRYVHCAGSYVGFLFTVSSAQADLVTYQTTWTGRYGNVGGGVDVDASGNVYVVRSARQ